MLCINIIIAFMDVTFCMGAGGGGRKRRCLEKLSAELQMDNKGNRDSLDKALTVHIASPIHVLKEDQL